MGEIVYVDLLFLINFSMDFICFYITAKILSEKLSTIRAVLASAIGGIYSDIALFITLSPISALLIDIAACVLITSVALCKRKTLRRLPMYILVYFAVSMALGGFMTAIFNLLNRADIQMEKETGGGISVLAFIFLAGVSAVITLLSGRFFRGKSSERITEVNINIYGRSKTVRGLVDSGNLLCEPISGIACIVCDTAALKEILPYGVYIAAMNCECLSEIKNPLYEYKGIRLVPTKTASGSRLLLAIRPDKIKIDLGNSEKDVEAYIALGNIENGADGCQALVPSALVI